jgi:hypothetical protein
VSCNIEDCDVCKQANVCFSCVQYYQLVDTSSCVLCAIANCTSCDS